MRFYKIAHFFLPQLNVTSVFNFVWHSQVEFNVLRLWVLIFHSWLHYLSSLEEYFLLFYNIVFHF